MGEEDSNLSFKGEIELHDKKLKSFTYRDTPFCVSFQPNVIKAWLNAIFSLRNIHNSNVVVV